MGSMFRSSLLLVSSTLLCVSGEFLMGGHLDNKQAQLTDDLSSTSHLVIARTADDGDLDLIAEESASSVASTPYPDQEPRYKLPYAFAFNGGKPFSLEKDPITGKIDFEKAPPLKALNLTETYHEEDNDDNPKDKNLDSTTYGKISYLDSKRVVSTNSKNERVGPNEINPYSPSFHDFLNLPVRYSSEKYERDNYPLISSSYANTKVQSGSNSYNINNHRPYHQETATKVSISTATRKVYYPKTTTTTTTTTTTMKPTTPSTTTTTKATTTMKPIEKKTTTIKPTKAPTTTISTTRATTTTTTTTTQAPITQPKVTTWKPSKSTTRYDEYEDVLPIEKLQGDKYGAADFGQHPPSDKDINGHNNGPQSPTRVTTQSIYDYNDGYEDYESSLEDQQQQFNNQYHHHQQQQQQQQQQHNQQQTYHKIDLQTPPSTAATTTTSTSAPTTTTPTPTIVPSTLATSTAHHQQPITNIHLTTTKPFMIPVHQQPPVTSMPLDSTNSRINVPPVHENFVEGHRPVEFYNGNANVVHQNVHFSGSMYSRPGSVVNVLPESTSNVIVPHDQDTVSFVLGNRQNVEGTYYSHGVAMEEHPYAPNVNENNFRPFYSSNTNIQQPVLDQKVSVALPSVAVIEPSSPTGYNPTNWGYNPNINIQNPVQTGILPDAEIQNTKPSSSVVFPSTSNNEDVKTNNQKDAATQTDDHPVSGFVKFPDSIKDKQDDLSSISNQRPPIEEHIIVINQADGTIKEITPTGSSNPADNTAPINGNTNINNPNLPQLSESLTPPAEIRPSRPPVGNGNQRPPHYFHYQHGNGPNTGKTPSEYPPRPQRIPLPPRQKPELPPVGFKRRPTPPHDVKLPNILPQFRPNAKTSHGHRGTDRIGTLPAPPSFSNRPRPPTPRRPQPHPPISPPPSHLQRLSPPPPPTQAHPPHHPNTLRKKEDVASLPNPEHLKRYRPNHRPVAQKLRMEDELSGDRFSAEPPQIPPRPIIFPKDRSDSQMPKIATLQMIQQRGGLDEDMIRSNLPPLMKINRSDERSDEENSTTSNDADRRKDSEEPDSHDAAGASDAGPVYVVYPVNSAVNIGSQEDLVEPNESVVIGTRGPHRPLPPDTLPHDDEEDDHKQNNEKLPGYFYGKLPQHHNTVDFASQGYPIEPHQEPSVLVREKPLLVPSDDTDEEETKKPEENNPSDSSFNVISYLQDFLPFQTKKQQASTISATLPRLPSSPIAYVYTPTTPSNTHRYDLHEDDEEEEPRPVEKPVLLPSQQPSSSSSSAPSPQNFMAPFVASVSAEMPVKNGWSVVVSPAQVNGTERANDDKRDEESQENDAQTENTDGTDNFDPENFKPQLFGGFKPIYEFPMDEEERTPMVGRGVVSSDSKKLHE